MAIFRIVFVSILVLIGLFGAIRGPLNALWFYLWIAYFRPDIWVENDFLVTLKLSLFAGIIPILLTIINGVKFRFTLFTGLLSLALVHSLVSASLSEYSSNWVDFLKIILIAYLITLLIKTEKDLKNTLIVITLSLGFFDGAKQGWQFLILHPGAKNFNGLPTIGDNNDVAVAMLMLVPILIALSQISQRKIIKYTYIFLSIGVIYRALSTYSRGGFLTFLTMCIIFWLRSRHKFVTLILVVLLAAVILPTFPQSFWDRMDTITADEGEQDSSVRSRIHFWKIAWEMAKDHPVFGVGHGSFKDTYLEYDPSAEKAYVTHSAWFGVMSEWGIVGFIIFMGIYFYSLYSCKMARKKCKDRPELKSIEILSGGIQTSLIICAVGITFLTYQYKEILWHYFALAAVSYQILKDNDELNKDNLENVVDDESIQMKTVC